MQMWGGAPAPTAAGEGPKGSFAAHAVEFRVPQRVHAAAVSVGVGGKAGVGGVAGGRIWGCMGGDDGSDGGSPSVGQKRRRHTSRMGRFLPSSRSLHHSKFFGGDAGGGGEAGGEGGGAVVLGGGGG